MSISSAQKAIKTTYFSIAGNFVLALLKWLAGYFLEILMR